MKKTISIILAILMVVTMLPMAVLPAGAVSQKQDGFTVYVTYGVCKYCGDQHAADDVNIKSISVQNGKVTFQLSVSFKNRGDCSKTANVKAYSGVDTTYYYFTYTITDDFSCEQSYLINESYGQNFGEDKPKLLYSISRKEGHQASSWAFNGTKHSGTCELCGKTVNDNCSGGTATCMEKATCSTCGNKYGSLASDNHDWSNLDGICANGCGAECSHKWGEGVLTRPTKTEEGYYTYTCSSCDAAKTEAAQRAANYAEYTKALNDLRAYLDSDKLTDDVKASVAEWLEIYDSDEAYKFIAGEEETVTLYIEAALYYATEIEAAIQDCLAGNHSGNGEYCDICGAALHTCDFTGEWKFDDKYHWKECDCGNVAQKATHPYGPTCTCGYVCPHAKTYTLITRPVQNADGTWGKGELEVHCNDCGSIVSTQELERDHEGYALLEETLAKLEAAISGDKVTASATAMFTGKISGVRGGAYGLVYTQIDTKIAECIETAKGYIEEFEAGFADGTYRKADFTYMTALFDEINALIDNDPEKLIPSVKGDYTSAKSYYNACVNNVNYSQANYDSNEELYDYENKLAALIAGINDGTALKVDGFTVYTERGREWLLKFADEGVYEKASELILNSTEVGAKLDEIYDFALSLEGNVAENAENIAKIEADIDEFFGQLKKCVYGIHNVSQYKEISPAKCGENAIESAVCTLCGETVTREVENSALKHSFTKYEETEAPKCGVAGKEVAYCDNGCGETDEKAIDALTHTDADGDYICDNGCGHEFEKPFCEDCGRPAHEGEINEFICLILSFFKLLYSFIMAIK